MIWTYHHFLNWIPNFWVVSIFCFIKPYTLVNILTHQSIFLEVKFQGIKLLGSPACLGPNTPTTSPLPYLCSSSNLLCSSRHDSQGVEGEDA